ncbi:hypothetical protein VCRA2119O48_20171 [Vibrio crassostreae]|nr:hypothetical protein VCRA2119O48_20171 [Vibrio crassostreae]CAK3345764.1 hypothetical protein VCRA2122O339_200059 [Vibrio crassostreae]
MTIESLYKYYAIMLLFIGQSSEKRKSNLYMCRTIVGECMCGGER